MQAMLQSKRVLGAAAAAFALVASLVGCSATSTSDTTSDATATTTEETAVTVNVGSLKGPTSMGLVDLMQVNDEGEAGQEYNFTIATAADELVASVIKGDLDIALVPANVASTLYNKTEGGVTVLDINTLSVLYLVTGDESVNGLEDVAGKTIYLTGKGTTPEYALTYLLDKLGLSGQVTLEFKSEAAEVVSALAQDPTAVGVLPQPYATAASVKNEALRQVVNLGDVWQDVSDDASQLVTGVTIVRNAFLEEHPKAVATFMEEQAASVTQVTQDPEAAAALVVSYGILDSEAVAAKALPLCGITYVTGQDMKDALQGYLEVLYSFAPESVGGALPSADFYYEAQ